MAGNVAEWVADWYQENYYQFSPTRNPKGPTGGREKVVRGGSFQDVGTELGLRLDHTWLRSGRGLWVSGARRILLPERETLRSAAHVRRLRRAHGAQRVESPRGRAAFARRPGPPRIPLRHPRSDSRHRVRPRSLRRQNAAGGVALPLLHRKEAAVGPRRSATSLPGVSGPMEAPRLHVSVR